MEGHIEEKKVKMHKGESFGKKGFFFFRIFPIFAIKMSVANAVASMK